MQKNYLKALGKGILKVMSKMGISTYQSYCGAQIFDAVGLQSEFVEKYFTGTATTIEGADLQAIAEEALVRHARAYGDDPLYREMLDLGGDYAFRLRGEAHAWTPQSIAKLQHAVRGNSLADYKAFAATINDQSERLLTIRGLMQFRPAEQPVPLDEVEPAANIVRRFCDRRDELRLDQPRGAHDAGDRDEPHRRQVEHRRGRRGGRALQAAAERRLDALGDQAGRLGPVRRHHRIPRQRRRACRSRWRRAPSPAKAANCPAARSTRRSPGCAIRPPGSG